MRNKPSACLIALAITISIAATAAAPDGQYENNRYWLTDAERELVERVVMAEARGETLQGQMAVAQVIYNRLMHDGFPDSVAAVIRSEFAKPYKGKIFESVKLAVKSVFDMGVRVFMNDVCYFMNPITASINGASWIRRNAKMIARIGSHEFYR